MTLGHGQPWGELVSPPDGLVEVDRDAAVVDRPVRLTGGDLLACLGGPTTGPLVARFAVDLMRVVADGTADLAVAHVVARGRSWWRGPISAVCNVDRVGRWDVAPRAHPGDGRLDVLEVDATMSVRARWQAWRRLPTGTHVPHPSIGVRRTTGVAWTFDPPRRLWIDGRRRGTVRELAVEVIPTGAVVYT